MKKASIIPVCLICAAAVFVCADAFAQKDAPDAPGATGSVEALEVTEESLIDSAPVQPPPSVGEEVRDEGIVDGDS